MEIKKYTGLDQCSRNLAGIVANRLHQAMAERSRATLVLGGGSTPKRLHTLLAEWKEIPAIQWEKVHIFWGDERCVPLDDPDSNFRMAYETLIQHIDIPKENIHRPPVHRATPELAAMEYERELRGFFADDIEKGIIPRFDVVLLGMGEDGHTASLFPGSEFADGSHFVSAVRSSQARPPIPRISLTLPLLNRARHVFFLAAGRKKIDLIEAIKRERAAGACLYPAGCVDPEGELVWFVAETNDTTQEENP